MHHYVYCIENLDNGKVYVGKHSTNNLNDGYMGSGKILSRAIKKHGLDRFRKHILETFETAESAFEFERQLVDEDFIADDNTYNLVLGGDSCWAINSNETLRKEKNRRAAIAMNKTCWADPEFRARKIDALKQQTKRLFAEGKLKGFPSWAGKRHTEETKRLIGQANSVHQSGEGNSQFGTVWINNPKTKVSKKVKKNELQSWLDQGWQRGRKMKW